MSRGRSMRTRARLPPHNQRRARLALSREYAVAQIGTARKQVIAAIARTPPCQPDRTGASAAGGTQRAQGSQRSRAPPDAVDAVATVSALPLGRVGAARRAVLCVAVPRAQHGATLRRRRSRRRADGRRAARHRQRPHGDESKFVFPLHERGERRGVRRHLEQRDNETRGDPAGEGGTRGHGLSRKRRDLRPRPSRCSRRRGAAVGGVGGRLGWAARLARLWPRNPSLEEYRARVPEDAAPAGQPSHAEVAKRRKRAARASLRQE